MKAVAFLLTIVAAAAVVSAATAASGGGRPAFHEHVLDDSGVDTDFCGTGKTVEFDGQFQVSVWIGETGGDPEQELKVVFSSRYTLTNPLNGNAVVDQSAGEFTNRIVLGEESGPHTHLFVDNGLRAKLKLVDGRVLTRDAGSLVYEVSFDADDEVTNVEIVADHGSHAAFDTPVWCDEAIEALGL